MYAIGDVHGEAELLARMLTRIAEDARDYPDCVPLVVGMGDYVDRGPDSRGVLECLSKPLPHGLHSHMLLGNHEQAMLDFLDDPAKGALWLGFGGVETLASYGVRASFGATDPGRCRRLRDEALSLIPPHHLVFLRSLEPMLVLGDYVFVHAGIRPGRALRRQVREDLTTIRAAFLQSKRQHEKVVVHGHTIVDSPESLHNRVAIDTGAYASGILTALALKDGVRRFIQVSKHPGSRY
ncbi:metallophosphoesterase [Magnetospirillum molischianum]|uniref:metallophosphoesterase n=1 Tax=Magnetospirillum molischianum TaxID=1083 RepID=UPI00031F2B60|nr:metallophosphoesterase [Magnetospirillum molischianum]